MGARRRQPLRQFLGVLRLRARASLSLSSWIHHSRHFRPRHRGGDRWRRTGMLMAVMTLVRSNLEARCRRRCRLVVRRPRMAPMTSMKAPRGVPACVVAIGTRTSLSGAGRCACVNGTEHVTCRGLRGRALNTPPAVWRARRFIHETEDRHAVMYQLLALPDAETNAGMMASSACGRPCVVWPAVCCVVSAGAGCVATANVPRRA